MEHWGIGRAFAVFDAQDSGCRSWGVEHAGQRWFVKTAVQPSARAGLARAAALHAVVRHDAVVPLSMVLDGTDGPTLVYPWREGEVLNRATTAGSDRSALLRLQREPVQRAVRVVDQVLQAHRAVAAAGWVIGDLYDGCLLYDADSGRVSLIDLDEYRPGPFVLSSQRLPGSKRYMAPEEMVRGAVIDYRTSVFALGRVVQHLLDGPREWRGSAQQWAVVERATQPSPQRRYPGVAELVAAWEQACARA
ncbi:protein kinase family protein [Kineosporia babensis]|uniref:Protein kinase domain-containing protein n=1 Tax=Kineosporia babensis TaxID=499548 RepID=A0A9X1SVV4_9ACTN|nr:hypothetical protein [Kineosporia babensis]MCD5314064.1 hypothetical protein [Kineosporia babensis]